MQKGLLLLGFLFSSILAFANVSGQNIDTVNVVSVAPDSTLVESSDSVVADSAIIVEHKADSLVIVADSIVSDSLANIGDTLVVDTLSGVRDSLVNVADTLSGVRDSLANVADTLNKKARTDSTELVKKVLWNYRSDSIANIYQKALAHLAYQRRAALRTSSSGEVLDAYSLRLAFPPTFYSSSVLQQFMVGDALSANDPNILRMYMVNDALANMYVNKPELVVQIDDQVLEAGTLRDDRNTSLTTETKLTDKVVEVDLGAEVKEGVKLVTRKPNFWKFPGSGSLKFTQNYFSDNWYKGGENSYSFLGLLTLNANYDNRQSIQWENRLEARLGFQTTGSADKYHSMKPTDNLLRITSKFGYKAYKTFFYTAQVQANTQIVPLYASNSDNKTTDFLSPLNLTISMGMDYKFETKNKKFTGSVYVAPCTYNMKYVKEDDLLGRYGLNDGYHSNHTYGSSITINANWKIAKNISYRTRMYWISNYEYTNIEWENTFDFSINKYLSATLFAYPKFDDSNKSYMGDNGYIMMQEWFSLGLNYNW